MAGGAMRQRRGQDDVYEKEDEMEGDAAGNVSGGRGRRAAASWWWWSRCCLLQKCLQGLQGVAAAAGRRVACATSRYLYRYGRSGERHGLFSRQTDLMCIICMISLLSVDM
jgi:hypothetical protein